MKARDRTLQITAVAIAVSALAAACGLTTADATKTVTVASHVSIKSSGLDFSGKVKSSSAPCKQGRHVTLYRKLSSGGHQALGSTTTSSSGKWKVTASGSAGISMSHFFARVKKRSEGTAGTIYVCKAASSKTIALQP